MDAAVVDIRRPPVLCINGGETSSVLEEYYDEAAAPGKINTNGIHHEEECEEEEKEKSDEQGGSPLSSAATTKHPCTLSNGGGGGAVFKRPIAPGSSLVLTNGHTTNSGHNGNGALPATVVEAPPRESWLLRLFESQLFDMSIAITYLFKSKEPGVLSYIGNKMFAFKDRDVDFYLFQLVTLYVHHCDVAEALHPYLIYRCRESSTFSLQLVWLLNAFCNDATFQGGSAIPRPSRKKSLGIKLKNLILSEELRPKTQSIVLFNNPITNFHHRHNLHPNSSAGGPINLQQQHPNPHNPLPPFKKTHHRSYSDAMVGGQSTAAILLNATRTLGDLTSGHAFDNGCKCLENVNSAPICNDLRGQKPLCHCGALRLSTENEFVKSLMNIGTFLQNVPGKELKAQRLLAELSKVNLNLPARVWLPIHSCAHMIVRIPPGAAVLLNSKDKAPFLVYMEAVDVHGDINSAPLPTKFINSLRQTKSEENLLKYSTSNSNGSTMADGASLTNGTPPNSQFTVCPSVDNDSDCWTPEDDEISKQYSSRLILQQERDTISQLSQDSSSSSSDDKNGTPVFVAAGDIRRRLNESVNTPKNTFLRDPEDPSAAAMKEPWEEKVNRIRDSSPYGHLQGLSDA